MNSLPKTFRILIFLFLIAIVISVKNTYAEYRFSFNGGAIFISNEKNVHIRNSNIKMMTDTYVQEGHDNYINSDSSVLNGKGNQTYVSVEDFGAIVNPDYLFVEQLYREILGREPDFDGLRAWMKALDSKMLSRKEVIMGFYNSEEFIDKALDRYLGGAR